MDADARHDSQAAAQQRFLSLFLRSEREIFRYVAVLVPNVTDAEDIVQQTALALWEKFDAYDPSQQIARLSGEDLAASIPGATYLLCNEYELGMVQKKTGWSIDEIRSQVAVLVQTLGKDGSIIYADEAEYRIPAVRLSKTVDPTGAGDAYRGGLFAAVLAGLPWEVAGRVGAICGAYALENPGTSSHKFTLEEMIQRYADNFGHEPRLAKLSQEARQHA